MRSTLPSIALALLLVSSTTFLQAAELSSQRMKAVPKNPADKVYDAHTLTPQQVLHCLRREQALLQRVKDMKQEEGKLTDQASRVQQMGQKLKLLETQVNLDDTASMDDFRFRVDIYRRAEQKYNTRASAFNQRLSKLKSDQELYNNECAAQQFYEDDYHRAANLLLNDAADVENEKKTAQTTPSPSGIYLQLGAFRQKQSVTALFQRLAGEKELALHQYQNSHGLTVVRTGPFADAQEAKRIQQYLAEHYAIKAFIQSH